MPSFVFGVIALVSGIGFLLSLTSDAQASQANTNQGPLLKLTKWSDADFQQLDSDAADLKMNPPDYLLMMAAESFLDPQQKNPISGAVGLNQLTSAADSSAGITEDFRVNHYGSLGVSEQLPYVKKYFQAQPWTQAGKTYDHAGMVWQANFAPGTMVSKGTSLDTVLYSSGGPGYKSNQGLDSDNKGTITVRDLVRHLAAVSHNQVYRSGLARLRTATGKDYSPILPS